jgi:hypothetical protein
MYLKLTRAFCFGGLAYRQNCNVFPAMPVGRRLESYRTGPDIVKSDVIKRSDVIKECSQSNQLELFDRFDRGRKFARENLRNEETAPTVHLISTHSLCPIPNISHSIGDPNEPN